ncbi:MAG: lipopolysaccharide biosynthesis protein [Spirochaetaceae bacterium]|jgi:uncharacterized protein involved in exopolysaccharide biosynthesis|nr:lipopolysaccharide biosynthesis protein [Spirochaetaceae bacterium]
MDIELMKESDDEEISLIDLFAVLWRRKILIIAVTLIAAIGVTLYMVVSMKLPVDKSPMPNVYTPKAHLILNDMSSGSNLSSVLSSSGLGSLARLAGTSGGTTSTQLALYLVTTNSMLDAVVDNFNMLAKYNIKGKSPRSSSRRFLKSVLKASTDEKGKSGVFTISFTDTDPVFAQGVVNFCVDYLEKRFDELGIDKNKREKANLEKNLENTLKEIENLEQKAQSVAVSVGSGLDSLHAITLDITLLELELQAQKQVYTQLKVQYELLKVTMASEKPVFQILERAEAPDQKSGPRRGLICIIATFGAGFLGVILAFILNAIDTVKKDPSAMAKLRGEA